MKTVYGAGELDESTRTELETEVGDVLSRYVVRAFLGDYPRENFVPAFDSFTGGRHASAAEDIDVLTGARFAGRRRGRRHPSGRRLSFLVTTRTSWGRPRGVRFAFEAAGRRRAPTVHAAGAASCWSRRPAPGRSSGTTWPATTAAAVQTGESS